MGNRIIRVKNGFDFDRSLKRANERIAPFEEKARKEWNAKADKHNQWDSLGEDEKFELISEEYDKAKGKKKKKFRRSAKYDIGQHELICEALKVSPSPDAPGDTAYEAVCELLMKIEMALAAKTLKEAKAKLSIKPGSMGIIKLYGKDDIAVIAGVEPRRGSDVGSDPLLAAAFDLVSASRRVRSKFGVDDSGHPLDWTEWRDVDDACNAIDRIAANKA